MIFPNALYSSLLSLILLSPPTLAQIKPEQLGIAYNKEFFDKTGRVVFGSIVVIDGLDTWNNNQIAELAFRASDAVSVAFEESSPAIRAAYQKRHRRAKVLDRDIFPVVTTTLVVDNTAYISTSIKGTGTYLYKPASRSVPDGQPRHVTLKGDKNPCRAEVIEALERCQLRSPSKFKEMREEAREQAKSTAKELAEKAGKTFDEKAWEEENKDEKKGAIKASGHRTGASCGEPMAALAYCTTGSQKRLSEANAKVMAVDRPLFGKARYANPCGGWGLENKNYPGEWGCKVLMNSEEGLNIKVISKAEGNTPEKMKGVVAAEAIQIHYP